LRDCRSYLCGHWRGGWWCCVWGSGSSVVNGDYCLKMAVVIGVSWIGEWIERIWRRRRWCFKLHMLLGGVLIFESFQVLVRILCRWIPKSSITNMF
jgi:hypothetical protein